LGNGTGKLDFIQEVLKNGYNSGKAC